MCKEVGCLCSTSSLTGVGKVVPAADETCVGRTRVLRGEIWRDIVSSLGCL